MEAQIWENLLPELKIREIESRPDKVIVHASVRASNATCPRCGEVSYSVHSYRQRQVTDLPVLGR